MKGLYLILLSFLFGCNLPDMQTGKEVSYYFDQTSADMGRNLCLWETAVSV